MPISYTNPKISPRLVGEGVLRWIVEARYHGEDSVAFGDFDGWRQRINPAQKNLSEPVLNQHYCRILVFLRE
jgi:hypothetical protein